MSSCDSRKMSKQRCFDLDRKVLLGDGTIPELRAPYPDAEGACGGGGAAALYCGGIRALADATIAAIWAWLAIVGPGFGAAAP